MKDHTMFASSPEIQIEIDILVNLLKSISTGAVLSYADASMAIGRNVQKEARVSLIRARGRVEKETGLRFGTISRVGVRRLGANEVAGIGADARHRIGRIATRQSRRLTDMKYNDIDRETQSRIDAERSLLGAISSLAGEKARKSVEIGTSTGPMPATLVFQPMKSCLSG